MARWLVSKATEVSTRDAARRMARKIGVPLKTILKWRREGQLSDYEIHKVGGQLETEESIVIERKTFFA